MLNFPDSSVETEYTDSNNVEWAFDGVGWVQKIGVNVSGGGDCNIPILDSPPANPELGEQWFSSTDGYLYIWYGSEWVAIGGAGGGDGGGSGGGEEGDPYWFNVELLINCDGQPNESQNILDVKGKNAMIVVNNTKISTGVVKYGTGSVHAPNESGSDLDYCITDGGFNLQGDFTLEWWMMRTGGTGGNVDFNGMVCIQPDNGQGGIRIAYQDGGITWRIISGSNTYVFSQKSTSAPALMSWAHYAMTREGSQVRCYVDGFEVASGNCTSPLWTNGSGARLIVGGGRNAASGDMRPIPAYFDDVRVTDGVARYVSDFTPPKKHPTKEAARKAIVIQEDAPQTQEDSNDADLS
jgi:hypothetical protein